MQDIEVSASGCPGVEVCEVSSEGSEKDDLSPMETENKCIVFQGAVDTENASPETPVDTENLSPGTHVNPENVSPQTPVDTENLSPETHFDPENVPEKLGSFALVFKLEMQAYYDSSFLESEAKPVGALHRVL